MINSKKELKKNIATIHCKNSLSLLQRKISNALLFHAYPNLKSQEEHEVSIKKLCEIIGYFGHNTDAIKNAIRELITTLIEWNVIDEAGQEDWTASTILASVRLHAGRCIYAYSPRMRDLLFSPKMYGKINIAIQSKFKSSYGLALYENCIRYQGLPQTRWFELEIFRKLMGVPQDKYQIFRDFNKRVLLKAVEEVNLYSDLHIEPDVKRKGRTVAAIRFRLSENEEIKKINQQTPKDIPIEQEIMLEKLSTDFSISNSVAEELLRQYDLNYINEKIRIVENSKQYKIGKVTNLAAYLLSALKDDYKDSKCSKVLIFKKNKKSEQAKIAIDDREQAERQYNKYKMNQIEKYIAMLNEEEKENLKFNFKNTCIDNDIFAQERFNKFGMEDFMVKSLLKNYVKGNYPVDILTFDEWLKKEVK